MLRVEHYERIRRKVKVEGQSQRETARELHHSRKTVAKALEYSSPPPYTRRVPPGCPVLEPFKPIIEAWLEEDQLRPRKQRHTATRIWQRLREEHGFPGGERTVRRYVAYRRATGGEVFLPLAFDPGEEAQFDWGQAQCILGGVLRTVFFFCVRLGYSTASFVRAYLAESQEALLDGHVRVFEFFGGVPRRGAYDNPKSVVLAVGKGPARTLTKRFLELKSHYLFETRFCNVAAGNEKGHVENLVKHAQRTFLTPLPEVADLEALNAYLLAACAKDLDRQTRGGRTRRELLVEERARFLPLPARSFAACKQVSTIATKLALVRFANNDYSVPVAWAHHLCRLEAYVERVELFVGAARVAVHPRSYETGEFVLDWRHYLPLLEQKPGGLHNGRPFKGEPWGAAFTALRQELDYRYGGAGTRKFIRVLLLFTEFPEAAVKEAVEVCVRRSAFSEEAVRSVLTYEPRSVATTLDLAHRPELAAVGAGVRPAGEYDVLLGEGVPA